MARNTEFVFAAEKGRKHFINRKPILFTKNIVGPAGEGQAPDEQSTAENIAEADKALNRGRFALRVIFPMTAPTLLITHRNMEFSERLADAP